ncbi:MAG: beta-ketoacyl-ACP synthase III [Chloroflexota bacterium]|nr:beta-ketoacyl-ACP synthase III [Chloroflexota bacterium]
MKRYGRITGWGRSVPQRVLTNHDLEQMVDTSDEWIVTRTGIRERRIAGPDETASTMSVEACQKAMERAGVSPEQIDLIIIATSTPDYFCPPVSSMVQDQLNATRAGAFTLVAGCTGFVYGLVTANQFIETGLCEKVLVVGVEKLSSAVDWTDRNTCVLFGDGGAAVLMEASDQPTGILSCEIGSDGSDWDALIVPAYGTAVTLSEETLRNRDQYIRMDGRRIFKFATRKMTDAVINVVRASGLAWDDIDLIIPHQANARIIELATRRLKVAPEKVMVNLDRYGNTSAASIPLALCDALQEGRLKSGDHAVLIGFGAGLTWAAAVLHWQPERVEEEPIRVEDWPLLSNLFQPVTRVRNAMWSTQVSARARLQDATLAAMTPINQWQKRFKRQ